jgi:KDO2-lipid IV(A) lauroyltransferase
VGSLLYVIVPSRRRLTLANLRRAYPTADRCTHARIARASYSNLVTVFTELLATPYLPIRSIHRAFRFVNPEVLRRVLDEGKGVVLLSAHLANWEWSALAAAVEFGRPLLVVVKTQRNRKFNAWLDSVRRMTGNVTVPMFKAARPMLEWLQNGGIVALLGDQAAEPTSDVFVPLFGEPAATYKAPVVLARRTGSPIVFGYCRRADDGRYDVVFEVLGGGVHDDQVPIATIVAAYNQRLEAAIRQAPEQWVWQHNRWKYQPPEQP